MYECEKNVECGANRYRYDACGRLTERTEYRNGFRPRQWHYRWDAFGRLRELLTPDGERWRYRYDAFGRRISKTCLEGNKSHRPGQVDFLWQGSRLIEAWRTYTGTRREIQRWHYRPGSFEALAQERLRYTETPDPARSEWYPLACDPNGAPHTLYSSNGRALWRARHQLWGQTERDTRGDTTRTTLAHVVPDDGLARQLAGTDDRPDCELRFAGQWADEESGLHYNLNRYYDPQTGQYLSTDPIGLPGGLRTHAYVHDPLQWVDPWGLQGYSNRGPDGRFIQSEDGPAVYNRDSQYPSSYRAGVKEAVIEPYIVKEGPNAGKVATVDGEFLSPDDPNLTLNHKTSVVDHWNSEGYNSSRADRNDFYNDINNLEPMSRSANSAEGGRMSANGVRYDQVTRPDYSK